MSPALESASREDLLTMIGLLRRQVEVAEAGAAAAEARCLVLAGQNAALAAANERLTARVAELERRLNRDSGNSSLPPSSDTFDRPGRKDKDTTQARRKRGRQPGAPGTGLAMVDRPDWIRNHRPKACGGCGEQLTGLASEGYARRQVHDIPQVTVEVTEHRLHKVRCGGGRVTGAKAPDDVAGSPASYGPNLRALAVYLLVFQHVPVERCAQLIADVTGAQVSPGWVSAVLAEGAVVVGDSLDLIRALLVLGQVLHPDETTTRIGARRRWPYVACTSTLTLLGLAPRSRAGADSLGVLPSFRGTLVHDSLSLYAGYPRADHQLCGAHLIRELTAAEQDHPQEAWHRQIRWAPAGLNKQAVRVRSGEIPEIAPDALLLYLSAYHQGVAVGLSVHPRKPGRNQTPTRNLLERLRDQAHAVLRFAEDPLHVPFTNNTGEWALRPVKTQIKISGCHQSEDGAAAWLAVRSYLDSARKHGLNAFDAIRRAFTGNLWMPPITQTT